MQVLTYILLSTEELEGKKMKLARTCKKVRKCSRCKKDIFTTEFRWNRNNGTCEHLKGECK